LKSFIGGLPLADLMQQQQNARMDIRTTAPKTEPTIAPIIGPLSDIMDIPDVVMLPSTTAAAKDPQVSFEDIYV
jgi:hypothetical protein